VLVHNVYFTLKDPSPAAIQHLMAECRKYLTEHPGVAYFGVGTVVPDLDRPVNVRDFHVGLHMVFADRKAHDVYQVHERHKSFIEKNKDTWQQVRVFDSDV
jgi:hypothetical protein